MVLRNIAATALLVLATAQTPIPQSFKLEISAPSVVRIGGGWNLRLSLTNVSNVPENIKVSVTDVEIVDVRTTARIDPTRYPPRTAGGTIVEPNAGPIALESKGPLAPGKSISLIWLISSLYRIEQPGKYVVRVTLNGGAGPHGAPVRLQSNTLTLDAVDAKEAP